MVEQTWPEAINFVGADEIPDAAQLGEYGMVNAAVSDAALAEWLEQQPQVERVNYAGLHTHPQKSLIDRQMKAGGGVLSFTLKNGSREDAWSFLNATCLMSLTANLGDVKTTVCHPATSTHGRLDDADRELMGISENMIRIAVGLESVDDLIEDCERGFAALTY